MALPFTLQLSKLKQRIMKMTEDTAEVIVPKEELPENEESQESVETQEVEAPEQVEEVVGEQTPETRLINDLEKHYDVQLADGSDESKTQFIQECVDKSAKTAKDNASADPRTEADFSDKVGKLVQMWKLPKEPPRETPQEAA